MEKFRDLAAGLLCLVVLANVFTVDVWLLANLGANSWTQR